MMQQQKEEIKCKNEKKNEINIGWSCQQCTYFVDARLNNALSICPVCGTPRKTVWMCNLCHSKELNVNDHICVICKSKNNEIDRYKLARNVDGSWTCPKQNCHYINLWDFDSKCRSCNFDHIEIDPIDEEFKNLLNCPSVSISTNASTTASASQGKDECSKGKLVFVWECKLCFNAQPVTINVCSGCGKPRGYRKLNSPKLI